MRMAVPALWNQLRFNTDRAPMVANLVSRAAAPSPGAVLLGPDTDRRFVFADASTLEVAQRLARRDVQRMRETPPPAPAARREPGPSSGPATASASARPPAPREPVSRLCKAGDAERREKERKEKEEARRRQQEQQAAARRRREEEEARRRQEVRRRREEEEAELRRRREAREQQQQQQAAARAQAQPARGDSPPVRDTDPQVAELRAQHRELMGAIRRLARVQQQQQQPARRPPKPARPARPRGYLGGTRASKEKARPSRRRPCQQQQDEDDEEEEVRVAPPPRPLNELPFPAGQQQQRQRQRQQALRRRLEQRLARPAEVATLLLGEEEAAEETASESARDLPSPLPGHAGADELLEPTVDELEWRLRQIEAEHEAIRARWRTLEYEAVPDDSGPLLFTNRAAPGPGPGPEPPRLQPRPPARLTVGLSRAAERSVLAARQRFLDWSDARPGPRFAAPMATVADWLCDDLVEEALSGAVAEVDRAGAEILHLLVEAELAAGAGEPDSGDETEEEEEELNSYATDSEQ